MAVATSAVLRTWAVRLPAIELTLSVRSFQVPATPCTCAWPPNLPSVPTSRATRVTSEANERNWSTMVLITSLICRISPFTSTVIFCPRSPWAIAVATFDTSRNCTVRLPAIPLTLSVRSFQTPATPGTTACPPSFPSVPTSRATRVTSEEKERSWSTIVLMASLSWRNSPRTSTAIFLERSPFATEMVTSEMLRTWAVRLLAIELTLSVRSFHVPETPFSFACPPSFPSVPTSRATRVTSEVKAPSCSTMALTVLAAPRNSPWRERPSISGFTVCEKSPLETAPITRVISVMGRDRSSTSPLTEFFIDAHDPRPPSRSTRLESFPSFPTPLPIRSSSPVILRFRSITLLRESAILPPIPSQSRGRLTEKSPFSTATSVLRTNLRSGPDSMTRGVAMRMDLLYGDGYVFFSSSVTCSRVK